MTDPEVAERALVRKPQIGDTRPAPAAKAPEPKQDSAADKKKLSDLWRALNNEAEMKELAAKSGFELVNVGVEEMDAFMKERQTAYMVSAKRLGLIK